MNSYNSISKNNLNEKIDKKPEYIFPRKPYRWTTDT